MEFVKIYGYNKSMFAIYPEIINFANQRNVESLAVAVRKYFGSQSPKIKLDMDDLARELGLAVHVSDHIKMAAIVTSDKEGLISSHIFINKEFFEPHPFCDLIKAHLLGHFFLHMMPVMAKGEGRVPNFQEILHPISRMKDDVDSTEADLLRESEADEFALALLLPVGMFRRALNHFKTLRKTAEFFNCHVDIVRIRALRLRMILPDLKPDQKSPPSVLPTIEIRKSGLARIREIAQKLER